MQQLKKVGNKRDSIGPVSASPGKVRVFQFGMFGRSEAYDVLTGDSSSRMYDSEMETEFNRRRDESNTGLTMIKSGIASQGLLNAQHTLSQKIEKVHQQEDQESDQT